MAILKRIGFFILVNLLVITTLSIVSSVLGLDQWYQEAGINYSMLFAMCLVWGMGGSFISLFLSKTMAKWFYGVKIIDSTHSQYGDLVRRVHQFARNASLTKMPEVGIYESSDINAFATGWSKNHSLVAVSTGLLGKLNSSQQDGVLGHEVAHIANGDMVTMTLLQGVMNAFVMFFARIIAFFLDNALRNDRGEGGLGAIGSTVVIIVLQIFLGLLAQLVTSYFSRYREFRADEGGAKLASKNNMISALEALKANYPQVEQQVDHHEQIAAFRISSKGSFLALLSTHPPLEQRIAALKKLSI